MAAGLATLDQITVPGFYEALGEKTRMLTEGLQAEADFFGCAIYDNPGWRHVWSVFQQRGANYQF